MLANSVLEIIAGEQYRYNGKIYDILAISAGVVEMASASPHGETHYQQLHRLQQAAQRGRLVRVREAPFEGRQHRIIDALCQKDKISLNRRTTYVNAAIKNLGGKLPREAALELISSVAKKLNDENPPCYNTLRNWLQRYLEGNQCGSALIPSKKIHVNQWERLPEVIRVVIDSCLEKFYYKKTPESVSDIVGAIQASLEQYNRSRPPTDKIVIPSESTLRRRIREKGEYRRLLAQKGLVAALNASKFSIKNQHHYRLLERVEGDTHSVDVELVDSEGNPIGKAALTAFIDVGSRKIIGWDLSINPPSALKSMRALKVSLIKYGVAEEYRVDNGPENTDKEELSVVFPKLGPNITYCKVKTPDEKPYIERWFLTFALGLSHKLIGTTFSNPEARGAYPSEKMAIYTLEQLRSQIDDYIENIYHQDLHDELNTSPNEIWKILEAVQPPLRRIPSDDISRMFFRTATSKITNGRVRFNNLQWTCSGLFALSQLGRNKNLIVNYDPSDLGVAVVFHPDYPDKKYYADAVDPRYQIGLTLDCHREIRKRINEIRRKFNFSLARAHKIRMMEERYRALAKHKRGNRGAAKVAEKIEEMVAGRSSSIADIELKSTPPPDSDRLSDLFHAPAAGDVWEIEKNE